MQKTPLTILINGLLVLSLLLPSLPVQAQTGEPQPTPTQTVEASPTPEPLLTPSPEPIPTTPSPTPTIVVTQVDQPTPTPIPTTTPTPIPSETPTGQEQSKPAFDLLLSAPSHELIPGETASMFWQITGWTADGGLTLEFNLPKELNPQLEPEQRFDPQTGKLEFNPSAAQGQLVLSSPEDAKGPFVIQAHLRQGEALRAQETYTFREAGLNQVEKEGGTAAGLSGRVQLTFPAAVVDETLEVRIRKPSPSHRPAFSFNGQTFEILAQGQSSGQDLFRPSTFTIYDVLGRPRQASAPDNTPTTWSYTTSGASAPDGYRYTEVCQTNALGGTTCTRADLLGRVRKAIPPTGPAVAYSYDMEDQLLQVQRGGATTSLSYDLGGRKLQMNDPDMGVWNYAYDALGNLTRQTDARGQRICLYYDGLNRLTGKHFRSNDDNCPTSNPSLWDQCQFCV